MTLAGRLRVDRDARSIGLALVLLVLVNAIAAGIAGAARADSSHSVFCGAAGGQPGDGALHPNRDHDCCIPAASAAPEAGPPVLGFNPLPSRAPQIARDDRWESVRPLLAAEPRGPPLI
ncbi:MAG TPA: hypothetical protein VFB16_09995 [Bauldia sp.]|nr:hypothetical protein [Bauldia sp.]